MDFSLCELERKSHYAEGSRLELKQEGERAADARLIEEEEENKERGASLERSTGPCYRKPASKDHAAEGQRQH